MNLTEAERKVREVLDFIRENEKDFTPKEKEMAVELWVMFVLKRPIDPLCEKVKDKKAMEVLEEQWKKMEVSHAAN